MARANCRQTVWIGSNNSNTFGTLAANGVVIDQSLVAVGLAPFTITRTVGVLVVKSDQVAAAEEGTVGLGAMLVREPALAIGITAVPTPLIEMDDDGWFLFQMGSFSGGPIEGAPVRSYPFDSRAQRKVVDGDAVIWTLENASATAGCEYDLWFRMLIKLH